MSELKCKHYDFNLHRCNMLYGCRNQGRPETDKDIKIYDKCKGYTKACKFKM